MDSVKDVLGKWGKKAAEATKKAEDLAGNMWQHCEYYFTSNPDVLLMVDDFFNFSFIFFSVRFSATFVRKAIPFCVFFLGFH